ncbi:unnamed protein product [Closterium sp. Naga37s-1]|nr:unnamed protein product [Closterium sp. Naga37s-1]
MRMVMVLLQPAAGRQGPFAQRMEHMLTPQELLSLGGSADAAAATAAAAVAAAAAAAVGRKGKGSGSGAGKHHRALRVLRCLKRFPSLPTPFPAFSPPPPRFPLPPPNMSYAQMCCTRACFWATFEYIPSPFPPPLPLPCRALSPTPPGTSYTDVLHSRRPCAQSKFGTPLDAQALTDAYLLHTFGTPLDTQALTDAYLLHALNHAFHTRDRITKNTKSSTAPLLLPVCHSPLPLPTSLPIFSPSHPLIYSPPQLNHIFHTRDRITTTSPTAPLLLPMCGVVVDGKELVEVESIPRDQGFTRPKVLILLPYRNAALSVVQRLLRVTPPQSKVAVEHLDRFLAEFGEVESEEEESEEEDEEERRKARERKRRKQQQQVGRGKAVKLYTDFYQSDIVVASRIVPHRIFCSIHPPPSPAHPPPIPLPILHPSPAHHLRKAVKLYTDFYQSDIIVASPIGLVTKLGEAMEDSEKDMDFLSSIEIVIVDQADVILMQNWAHVEAVFAQLNKLPVKQHGTDFMRVREWYLNGWAGHYRQSIVLSAFSHPSINALFHRSCCNFSGKVKLRSEYAGVLALVVPQVQQVFDRVDCTAITAAAEARFQFFVSTIFPRLRDSVQGGVLVYTQSYFEFVRLRNFFKQENLSFCLLSEYTDERNVHRARAWFFQNRRRIMLYSERSHFYHRYRGEGGKWGGKIKGGGKGKGRSSSTRCRATHTSMLRCAGGGGDETGGGGRGRAEGVEREWGGEGEEGGIPQPFNRGDNAVDKGFSNHPCPLPLVSCHSPNPSSQFLNPLIGGTTRLIKASQTTPVPFPLCLVTPQTPHRIPQPFNRGDNAVDKGFSNHPCPLPLVSCHSPNPSSQFLNPLIGGTTRLIKASQTTPVPFPLCLVTPQTPHRIPQPFNRGDNAVDKGFSNHPCPLPLVSCHSPNPSSQFLNLLEGGNNADKGCSALLPLPSLSPTPFRASLNPSSQFLNLLEGGNNADKGCSALLPLPSLSPTPFSCLPEPLVAVPQPAGMGRQRGC